ncbi:4295_t:CDS:2, partial [Funneliformis mosseae]
GIFAYNVDLAVLSVRALKDRLLTLGYITFRDARLCRIDWNREIEMTMRSDALTKADLEKVLQEDYKISSGDITLIPQFKPVTCPVDENASEFKLYIDDILRRIRNMGPVVDSNEAMRCEYISTILHTALSLLKGLIITPQMKITGEINTGRVDYAIKKILDDLLEEIICITEGKQNQVSAKTYYNIEVLVINTSIPKSPIHSISSQSSISPNIEGISKQSDYSDHSIEKNNADPISQNFDSIPLNQTNISSVVDHKDNDGMVFDIQISEFSLEAILTGSSNITAQTIVDLFNVAMKDIGIQQNQIPSSRHY